MVTILLMSAEHVIIIMITIVFRIVPVYGGGTSVDDECGVCGGDNSSCADCAGVPNGDAYVSV